jgi:hypothetical protein
MESFLSQKRPSAFPDEASRLVESGRARCQSDVACGFTFICYSTRRSRIPARREPVCDVRLAKRWI